MGMGHSTFSMTTLVSYTSLSIAMTTVPSFLALDVQRRLVRELALASTSILPSLAARTTKGFQVLSPSYPPFY